MRLFWKHLLIILALAAVAYGFLWKPGHVPYSPHSDMVAQGYATKEILHRSIADGHGIPFWRSDQLSGYAALTNPLALYLFPLHAPFLFLPPEQATGIVFWLQFVTAAVVLYLFGFTLGLSPAGRLFMAIAGLFAFKQIAATYAGWISIPGVAFFPLLFAATAFALKKPGLKGLLFVAFTATLCFQGGHPQLFYYSVIFCAAFAAVYAMAHRANTTRGALLRQAAVLAGGCVLGFGIAAFLLLPQFGEFPLLSRRHQSYDQFLAGHSLGLRNLLTFFHPDALGTPLEAGREMNETWEDVAYFGILPLLLAVAGAILGWKRRSTRLLLAGFAISLALALDTPLLRLFYEYVPGYGLFRIPGRILFLTAFFGTGLAGIGLDEIFLRLGKKDALPGRRRTVALAALLVIISAEGAWHAQRYLEMRPSKEVLPTPRYAALSAADTEIHRVAPASRAVNYGWAAHNGMQLITGYDHLGYTHYHAYLDLLCTGALAEPQARGWTHFTGLKRFDMLAALNVKYLISDTPLNMPVEHFTTLTHFQAEPIFHLYHGFSSGDLWVHRFDSKFPRAWFAKSVAIARNESEELALLAQSDLFSVAIVRTVETEPFQAPPPGAPSDRAGLNRARDGFLSLVTEADGPRFLVVSEIWHPGWRAQIDGEAVPVLKTNFALQGVSVPAGRHDVTLEFRPLYWRTGLAISILSGLLFVALSVVAFRKRGLE